MNDTTIKVNAAETINAAQVHDFIRHNLQYDPFISTHLNILREENEDFDIEYEVGNYIYTAFNCEGEDVIAKVVGEYKWALNEDTLHWEWSESE